MPQKPGLSWRILEAYHGRVCTLLDYLTQIADSATIFECPRDSQSVDTQSLKHHLLRDSDPSSYRAWILTTLVAEAAVKQGWTRVKLAEPALSMTEVIDAAQARLFCRFRKPSNVLTAGYRSAELRAETGKSGVIGARQGVSNYFVNTMVTALQAFEWRLLLKRVGEAVLLRLLTEVSVYIILPNDCYCQIVGPPLIFDVAPTSLRKLRRAETDDLHPFSALHSCKRKALPSFSSDRPLKRRKTGTSTAQFHEIYSARSKAMSKSCSAGMIPISRVTMFYGRAHREPRSGLVHIGLPLDHVLHRMKTRKWRSSKGLPDGSGCVKEDLKPGDRDGALEDGRLRSDLFSRFEFINREAEIERKGSQKTPPQLRGALPLLASLYHRHTKCGYKALLNRICPSKLKPTHKDTSMDSSSILELISEDVSGELQTQMDYTMNTGISLSTLDRRSKIHTQGMTKPKFAEFTCDYTEVYLYVCAVTKAVIPHALWGCEKNRKAVLGYLKQIITSRRNEGITLHNVLQGISTSECDWLSPPGKPSRTMKQSEAEMLKRQELLREFIFWYFDQFLLALLRTTFYITESSAYRNRVLYFRQDDWDVLCQPLLDRLAETTFERIQQHEAEDILQQRKLGYSFVRLLPKDSGVRPIVNLRRKKNQGQSINQILSAAFRILDYEKENQADKLGASVFSPNETYVRLKQFKNKILDSSRKLPKLYFVKVDVKACFDTIEQSKLLEILKELISEDAYIIQRYGQLTPSGGRVRRKFVRHAMPEHEHPHFLTYAKQLATLLQHAIFVDQVVYPFAFRDEIVELLEDHITSNIVKIGNDYYRQRVGIPQGSVLSSLLCSFFYGDLEKNKLHFVTDPTKPNLLLRLIDDYLFITTDAMDAHHFLEVMNQGHPEYGCFIAREKTLTNFEHRVGDISQLSLSTVMHPDREVFPWCGYFINTEDLSIMTDYSRFHENYLTDSLSIERSRRPNVAFLQKLIQNAKAKTHVIFTDAVHNSSRVACINVHQGFVLTAMKMHAYIRGARHDVGALVFLRRASRTSIRPEDSTSARESTMKVNKTKREIKERNALRGEGAFLLKAIRRCIEYTHLSIRNRATSKIAREAGWSCDLTRDEVKWLGIHAFYNVLAIKRTAYGRSGVLGVLRADLASSRYNSVKRRLAGIARESLQVMLHDINF